MELSEEKKPIKNGIPEKIMKKVSSFPSMPRAGIKLRALLAEKTIGKGHGPILKEPVNMKVLKEAGFLICILWGKGNHHIWM